jgi:DDE superfamily endonuclease
MLAELNDRGVGVSHFAVLNIVCRGGLSFRKSLHASEQDRPDMARQRRQWRGHHDKIDVARLIFIDDNLGQDEHDATSRLVAKAPHGHWQTMTFVVGLRCDGIHAPYLLKGPINTRSFLAWVEQALAPILLPRDIVVMDNLGNHKSPDIRCANRAASAKLIFLPPYSPEVVDQNGVFERLKAIAPVDRDINQSMTKAGLDLEFPGNRSPQTVFPKKH